MSEKVTTTLQQESRLNFEGAYRDAPLIYFLAIAPGTDEDKLSAAARLTLMRHTGLHYRFPGAPNVRASAELSASEISGSHDHVSLNLGEISYPAIIEILSKNGLLTFDISNGPLVRTVILRTKSEPKALFGLVVDHLVIDKLSLELLACEINALYNDETLGQPENYDRVARIQRELLDHGDGDADRRTYWLEQFRSFGNYPPQLAVNPPERDEERAKGPVRHAFEVSETILAAVESRRRRLRVTNFAFWGGVSLYSARAVLDDTCAGFVTDLHGRISPEAMQTVGLFAHGAPIYVPLGLDLDLTIKTVHSSIMDAVDYQMPMRALAREFEQTQPTQRSPLSRSLSLYFADYTTGRTVQKTNGPLLPYSLEDHLHPLTRVGDDLLSVALVRELNGRVFVLVDHASQTVQEAAGDTLVRQMEDTVHGVANEKYNNLLNDFDTATIL